jgi:Fe-S-cluster containining protein
MPEKPRSVPLPQSGPKPRVDQSAWYAEGLRFECTQCGNCCSGFPGYVWLTIDDMARIASHLKMAVNDFTKKFVRRVGNRYSLIEKFNYDCIFLTRDGSGKSGCGIYPVRPMQCRTWPFWNDNLKSPAAWKHAAERGHGCPGMCDAEAPLYPLEHIEKCRQHPESPG